MRIMSFLKVGDSTIAIVHTASAKYSVTSCISSFKDTDFTHNGVQLLLPNVSGIQSWLSLYNIQVDRKTDETFEKFQFLITF